MYTATYDSGIKPAKQTSKKNSLGQGIPADDVDPRLLTQVGKHLNTSVHGARITRAMHSASMGSDKVSFSIDKSTWTPDGPCDGLVMAFWPDGSRGGGGLVGGVFEHHKIGQTVKLLENIVNGYVAGLCPAKGMPVFYGLISYDGKERTNLVRASNNWP